MNSWQEWLLWLSDGISGFATYWAILIGVAMIELVIPGQKSATPASPRLSVNLLLGLSLALIHTIPAITDTAMAAFVEAQGWGLLALTGWPLWLKVVLSFLAFDLAGYIFHRVSHLSQPMWRLHRVHHSDNDIDLSTIFRVHPASILIIVPFDFAVIAALGLHPLGIMAHGLAKLVTMGFGHANVAPMPWLSRTAALLFVTADFHRRHHSAWQPETDSNYGEVLTVWDRMFRSCASSRAPVERFGLGDAYDSDAASLTGQLKLPFISR